MENFEVYHVEKRGDFPTWKTYDDGGEKRLRRYIFMYVQVYVNLMFVRLERLLYIAFPYVDRESIIYMSVELSRRIYTHSLFRIRSALQTPKGKKHGSVTRVTV